MDQYKSSYQQRNPGGERGGGIAFAQKGKATAAEALVTAVAAAKDASTKHKPYPVPGEKDNKGKMLTNSAGKKNCFNCGGDNHWAVNCPDLTNANAQREELTGMVHISLLSPIIHTRYFIEAQGYSVEQNILFQDNQSTMRLEIIGSFSSSKGTKHIKCRYYFICDKIASDNDLEIMYCPTEIMWANVLTKPKQGAPFRLDRSHLMNILINYDDDVERSKTHPLLLPKDERNAQMNVQLPKAPLIHPRSVLTPFRSHKHVSQDGQPVIYYSE